MSKYLKVKYPLIAAVFVTIGYDYLVHFYADVPQGHWFENQSHEYHYFNLSIFHSLTSLNHSQVKHIAFNWWGNCWTGKLISNYIKLTKVLDKNILTLFSPCSSCFNRTNSNHFQATCSFSTKSAGRRIRIGIRTEKRCTPFPIFVIEGFLPSRKLTLHCFHPLFSLVFPSL